MTRCTWLTAATVVGLLYVLLLSNDLACAGPLPSAESVIPKKAYLPYDEEQTTTWTSSSVDSGGPFTETNKTDIAEIILNIGQTDTIGHMRQTRQASESTELPAMEQPYLFFVMRQFLVKIYSDGTGAQALRLEGSQNNAIACDFDARNGILFWSDVQQGAIYAVYENGSNPFQVVDIGNGIADGIAWDWITKKLYWTDARHKTVEVLDFNGTNVQQKLLFRTGSTSYPRAIVLDPTTKLMYLTDWGTTPSIYRASMDGTSKQYLHMTGLGWPNGLTIDYETQTLYWADAMLDRIEASNADGSNRRVLITVNVWHPFGLIFCGGVLYWTDWQARAVICASVATPRNFNVVISNLILDPMGIHMVSVEKQPTVPNPCGDNNGGCSHLCLLSNTSTECFKCACPDGMYISTDGNNCYPGVSRPIRPETPQTCIPECQNNGLCVSSGICRCMAGWTGARCDEPICTPECQNQGTCVETGICSCTEEWEGRTCEQAVCDDGYCLNGGECIRPNVCSCSSGWAGPRCERPVCSPNCANGMCTAPNTCTCEHGWNGGLCDQPICNPGCVNGDCIAPDVCECDDGWRGPLCNMPVCTQQCQHGGRCVAPDTCECTAEYTGALCETVVCFPPGGCLNGGICVLPSLCVCQNGWHGRQCEQPHCDYCPYPNGRCTGPNNCTCNRNWEGPHCTQAVCPNGCGENGHCYSPRLCVCSNGFTGQQCQTPVCTPSCYHGQCVLTSSSRECLCHVGWEGSRCEQAICHPPCANGGTCVTPGHCVCPHGILGTRCERTKS